MAEITRIQALARILNLQNISKGIVDITDERLSNLDYLQNVLEQEIECRSDVKEVKVRKQSKLPKKKFDHVKTNKGLVWHIEKLKMLEFIEDNQNIIVLGACGTGKTSLACMIGEEAIKAKLKVYYTTLDSFLEILSEKETSSKKRTQFQYMKECDLIILDDVFYTELSKEKMYLLYRNIIFLSETRSIICISNREISEWPCVTDDKHLMTTFRDRITLGSQILRLGY